MNTHPRGTAYFTLPPIASLQPPAPLPMPMVHPQAVRKEEDLSAISKAHVDIPGQSIPFGLSNHLKHTLVTAGPEKDDEIYHRILSECAKYADERKELVRGALKKRQRDSGIALSTIDKSKLRSRREAKVHRVKEREYDTALKDCIRWFISQRGQRGNGGKDVRASEEESDGINYDPIYSSISNSDSTDYTGDYNANCGA